MYFCPLHVFYSASILWDREKLDLDEVSHTLDSDGN